MVPEHLSTVFDEAVTRYGENDPADAVAFVVQETETESDRDNVLQAVAELVLSPEDLSRLEKREIFLAKRQKDIETLRRKLGRPAAERIVSYRHL